MEAIAAGIRSQIAPDGRVPREFNPEGWIGWAYRRGGFLVDFEKRLAELGSEVLPWKEVNEIANRWGYKPNGIGGWVTGKGASLAKDGDNWGLTDLGKTAAAEWRLFFGCSRN